ncbi:unnamed protein product [Haemonchus placei]|uniref:Extensin n=1 Tax=Haemonchus placei TaxID=6290 RepID=A0A0N4WNH8_HAEPC|nr:unnamed protein product [Haemonchus placei]
MLLLLLLLYLTSTAVTTNTTERPNLKYPGHAKRLRDEPIEGPSLPYGNKVYLKNRLLNNLNHFFPDPGETLEILGATEASQGAPVDTNSIIDQPTATGAPTQTFFAPIQNLLDNALQPDRHPFPTLIPTEATIAPIEPSTPLIAEEATPAKKSDYLPPSPSGDRRAFRTPGARNIVYIPASHVTMRPPPPVDQRPFSISVYNVTMTAPAITLPPLVTLPFPPGNVLPDYSSQFTTQQPYGKQYNSFSNQGTRNYPGPPDYNVAAPQFVTSPPVEPMLATPMPTDSDLDESDESFDPEVGIAVTMIIAYDDFKNLD